MFRFTLSRKFIDFNEKNREKEMPFFGQDIMIKAEAKGPLTSKEYLAALASDHRLTQKEGIDLVLKQYKLDALIAPTGGPAWLTDWNQRRSFHRRLFISFCRAGYPHITVPAGFVSDCPSEFRFRFRLQRTKTLQSRLRV